MTMNDQFQDVTFGLLVLFEQELKKQIYSTYYYI